MIPLKEMQGLIGFFPKVGRRAKAAPVGEKMRIRSVFAGVLAAATFVAGSALAQAENLARNQSNTLGGISLDMEDAFTPSQYDADGSVYGVSPEDIMASVVARRFPRISAVTGPVPNPTPPGSIPCDTATNFAGGWCNTAHNIAASAFGWNFSKKGKGVVIGIVDSGIDLNNPEFTGRILKGGCIKSSINPCTSATDKIGGDSLVYNLGTGNATHGTHVAGIAAGATTGLASQASILPVKVCATENCASVDDGIVWAAQHGASVINVSIGGGIFTAADAAKLRQAVSAGALIVVAAGNSGVADPTNGYLAAGALQDGIRGSMIVVGSTGCTANGSTPVNCSNGGKGAISSFSQTPGNRCQVSGGKSYCMKDYFVVAPGTDIWSAVGNGAASGAAYGYLSGTSMATPYVTGVAAVIKGNWPTLTSSQIASIIFQTTDDIGAPGVDPIFGRGEVDITKALSPVGATIVATKKFTVAPTAPGNGANTGTTSVAGLNGGALAATTLSKLGASGANKSLVSGPLSVAIRNSKLLKNAVLVDSFGRTFQADMTHAIYNPGLDFTSYFMSSPFTSYAPFAFSGQGPFGRFMASGYAVDTVTPRLLSGELLSQDRHRYDVRDLEFSAMVANGVAINAGYNLDLQGRFNGYDLQGSSAYDGLFLSGSALNSPYESFTDGGSFVGATIALASDLHLNVGQSMLGTRRPEFEVPVFSYLSQVMGPQTALDQRTATTSMAGLNWDFASWGGLGVTASNTVEKHGMLGGLNSGALAIADGANTSAVGLSARIGFGSGWVTTFSYSEGITQLDLRSNSIATSSDTLHSRAYGVAIAKHGLFADNDSLGLAVSRPIQIYSGSLGLTAATGLDDFGNILTGSERVSLASGTPETDFEMGYVTTFFDGALALQANAAWQQNLAGQPGLNSLAVLSRAKINF
jgi:subtilisin family serine protease